MRAIIISLILLSVPYLCFANTIHIPGDSATIQAGINGAEDGDTVFVAPGTYTENIDFSGKSIKVITSDGPETTTLQPADINNVIVKIVSGENNNTQFSGFTVIGGFADQSIHVSNGANPTISENILRYYLGTGVVIRIASDALIKYNLFHDNGGHSCIAISGGGTATIINNTFGNNARGFHTITGLGIAKNNIITNSSEYGIYGSFTELDFNDVWNNNPDYSGPASAGANDISEDPLYIDPAAYNYSLQPESPCIDAGDPAPEYNDPDGTRNDMGAFPYVSDAPELVYIYVDGDDTPTNVINNVPKFEWVYVDPTGENPQTHFEIAVGTDNDWQYAEMWNPAVFNSPDTFVTYAGTSLLDGETYYARLRIQNDVGWSRWYEISFRMNSVPTVPTAACPISNSIVEANQPWLYLYNSSDAEADELFYDFQVADDCTMIAEDNIPQQLDSTGWQVDVPLCENAFYFWRARAFDGFEYSNWTDFQWFWINAIEGDPTAFNLTFPPDTGWSQVYNFPEMFWWAASNDPDPFDSVYYRLYVSIDSEFTFVATYDSIYQTSLPVPALDYGTHYWWKVMAIDTKGNETECDNVPDFLTWVLGDANADNSVNLGDAVFLINLVFNDGPAPDPFKIGDVNGDCYVNLGDAVYLVNYVFKNGPEPLVGCDEPPEEKSEP